MKLSIVIPAYNEAKTIHLILDKIKEVQLVQNIEKEIIIVNDCSKDETENAILNYQKNNSELNIQYRKHEKNQGKGAALHTGIKEASGDWIIIQDADLELSPQEYNRLLEPILAGETAVVYGSRFQQTNRNIPRKARLANRFLTWLTNRLFRGRITDMETAYKLFRAELLQEFRLKRVSFDFEPEITAKILKAGYHIHEIPVAYHPRTSYEGKKIGWQDGVEAIWTLLICRFLEK